MVEREASLARWSCTTARPCSGHGIQCEDADDASDGFFDNVDVELLDRYVVSVLARELVARAASALHVLSDVLVEECSVQEGGR